MQVLNIINIDNFSFRIMNSKKKDSRIIVNIHSTDSSNEKLLTDDDTINENVNKFSVYLSRSNLGCFRLCKKKDFGWLEKGDVDYIQQTFIHLKLNNFINECITQLTDVDYDYCTIINNKNIQNIEDHIYDKNRMINKSPFIDYSIKCGHENKIIDPIKPQLKTFSDKLSELYNYSNNEFVCEHSVNDNIDNYTIKFYKLNLNLKKKDDRYIDNIILYYCNVNIEKFNNFNINKYLGLEDTKLNERREFNLPVFLTNDDKITKFGTFNKYIITGNYICKLFDYKFQCNPSDIRCVSNYQLIGDRYEDIFPINIIKNLPIEPSKTADKAAELLINTDIPSLDKLNNLLYQYLNQFNK